MSRFFPALQKPVRIGDTVLKNRMVFPNASPHFLQGPEEYPAEGYRTFMANIAKNGAAIVTIAEWADPHDRTVTEADFGHMQYFDIHNAACQNYMSQMADEVHFYGSKLIVSTDIKYPDGYTLNGGPSFGPPGTPHKMTKPLPKEMMPQVIDAFVDKVRKYRNLGYDGVTMRLDMMMQPSPKEREDEYGGNVVNRTRLALECYRAVKKALGKSFITEAQVAGEQPMGYTGETPNGYKLEDTIAFAREAQDCVDILQIREKDMTISHPTGYTFHKGEHPTIGYARAIKDAGVTDILLEPIGGFQDPVELEGYLEEGVCDMIGMARAFFCEPEYGKKIAEGRADEITPCLWCNKCHGTILAEKPDPWITVCSVNPYFGIGDKVHRLIQKPDRLKKVAVIGGGPVGMRAAIFAAQRGHKVTLFEKSDYLGGQLLHAEYFSFKWPLKNFKNWEVHELDLLGVDVRMNTQPAPEDIQKEGFDTVIAATGAYAKLPGSIKGLRDENGKPLVWTCHDAFGKEAELGRRVVICGASETGIETAMYLCENGHEVTLLTRQKEIGHDCSKLHYITMAWVKPNNDGTGRGHMAPAWEKYEDRLHGITEVTTKSVDGGTVVYEDKEENEHTIKADSVLICGGSAPEVDEALKYADAADQFLMVGDCNGRGNIQKGMRDALAKVNMI